MEEINTLKEEWKAKYDAMSESELKVMKSKYSRRFETLNQKYLVAYETYCKELVAEMTDINAHLALISTAYKAKRTQEEIDEDIDTALPEPRKEWME